MNTVTQTVTVPVGGNTQVPLDATAPSLALTYTPANSITVTNAGTYMIAFSLNVNPTAPNTTTAQVQINGVASPLLSQIMGMTSGVFVYQLQSFVALSAGAVVDLHITSPTGAVLTLGAGGAYLMVMRVA